MDKRIQSHHLHQLPKPRVMTKGQGPTTKSFKDMLNAQINSEGKLKISKHAEKRLQDREITIEPSKWSQISAKVEEAKAKGVHESLVILKDATLVVSTKNNTVITALDRDESKSQIFTNINGTIIIE
ncbi:hypothetical protein BKP37_11680 [Anaerobacillus alkalilacustris]|uniref:Flagellar protein n=1 Tax=Anaerobacillus alkalilacustris TaxID=393763 RepID=A0A1S2LLR9_9BACI|nr:TIGR02530 family flagellar biosynthesis protein [Anaerobacillus alkalilacustris]OIJ13160.1 hypothetical protein BKP37_11680 [Anaerobacillus alkalilacustris]